MLARMGLTLRKPIGEQFIQLEGALVAVVTFASTCQTSLFLPSKRYMIFSNKGNNFCFNVKLATIKNIKADVLSISPLLHLWSKSQL